MNRAQRRAAARGKKVPPAPRTTDRARRSSAVSSSLTSYEELAHHVRRFHRDQLLNAIAAVSSKWDGAVTNPDGAVPSLLPWNLAGLAAVTLGEGALGGLEPTLQDVAFLAALVANIEHPERVDGWESAMRMVARILYQQWP